MGHESRSGWVTSDELRNMLGEQVGVNEINEMIQAGYVETRTAMATQYRITSKGEQLIRSAEVLPVSYEDWMEDVERYLTQQTGMMSADYPDYTTRDCYNNGDTPEECGRAIVNYARGLD